MPVPESSTNDVTDISETALRAAHQRIESAKSAAEYRHEMTNATNANLPLTDRLSAAKNAVSSKISEAYHKIDSNIQTTVAAGVLQDDYLKSGGSSTNPVDKSQLKLEKERIINELTNDALLSEAKAKTHFGGSVPMSEHQI